MPRCPNCNYTLVLLEKRRKYKCAKCSKSYAQKEIELKDFQEFNKRERQKDKENVFEKPLPKPKQISLSKFMKKEYQEAYRKRNAEKISAERAEYYKKNKDKILVQQRNYRKEIGQAFNQLERIRRLSNLTENRQKGRIKFWRNEQKALAVKMVEERINNLGSYIEYEPFRL